ncbi:MAG: glycosyltransferase [bacterium]|nr:glycosyltransferase [bacterium]
MKEKKTKKISMAVLNDVKFDSRVLKEAGSLSKAGFDVTIIGLISDREKNNFEELNGFKIIRVPQATFNKNNFYKYFSSIFLYGNLTQKNIYYELLKNNSDFYHAHDLNTLLPCYRAAVKNKAKLIYDSHELFMESIRTRSKKILNKTYNFLTRKYFAYIEKRYIKHATRVITVNDKIADLFVNKYSIEKPIILLNAPIKKININNINLREILNLPNESKLIIYQGGQDTSRAVPETIEAMKYINNEAYLILIVIGDRSILEKKVSENKLEKKVLFLDPVSPDQLISYIQSCDIGVIPFKIDNLNKKLGLPNKLFEYMAAKIAVVATEQPVIKEIIDKHHIGSYFKSPTPTVIAEAINKLLSSNLEKTKINAFRAFNEHYNWEIEETKLIKLYNSII